METGNLSNKIAVCFSGQVRTFVQTARRIKDFIDLKNVDYFVHTWDTNTVLPYEVGVGYTSYVAGPATTVDQTDFGIIRQAFNPISMVVDNLHTYSEMYHKEVLMKSGKTPTLTVGLFNSMYKANQLKKLHEKRSNSKYGYVVKLRLDTVYDIDEILSDQLNFMKARAAEDEIYTKDFMNKLPESVEDICIIGTSAAMDIASNFIRYQETDPNKVKIDWQHRYAEYLAAENIKVRPWLNNNLYIYRNEHRAHGITTAQVRKLR